MAGRGEGGRGHHRGHYKNKLKDIKIGLDRAGDEQPASHAEGSMCDLYTCQIMFFVEARVCAFKAAVNLLIKYKEFACL